MGVGLGFSVAVEAQGEGVWAWGDNRLGQLGLGLNGGSVCSGHVHTRRVTAVGGRRLRCVYPSPSTLPTPQHAAEYFLHFADGSSSWTHATSCPPALQRWLACNEQFVAAAAELAKLGRGVESFPTSPSQCASSKPDSVLSNSVSLVALTPSPASKSAPSPLKLCCVPFSLQVYLHGANGVAAWTSRLVADWVVCDVSAAAAVDAVAAAAAATTASSPLLYGGPACPPLFLPQSLHPFSMLLTPMRSCVPMKVSFPSPRSFLPSSPQDPSSSIPHLRIKHISCGDRHVVAVDHDGSMWVWGCNSDGQVRKFVR